MKDILWDCHVDYVACPGRRFGQGSSDVHRRLSAWLSVHSQLRARMRPSADVECMWRRRRCTLAEQH